MEVDDIKIEDYHDFVNSLLDGPSLEAVASFRAEWTASHDRHHFRDVTNTFDEEVVFNSARVWWRGETATSLFVTDPIEAPGTSLFAEVGHERNGVFFNHPGELDDEVREHQ
jgi:hypothetical protein